MLNNYKRENIQTQFATKVKATYWTYIFIYIIILNLPHFPLRLALRQWDCVLPSRNLEIPSMSKKAIAGFCLCLASVSIFLLILHLWPLIPSLSPVCVCLPGSHVQSKKWSLISNGLSNLFNPILLVEAPHLLPSTCLFHPALYLALRTYSSSSSFKSLPKTSRTQVHRFLVLN